LRLRRCRTTRTAIVTGATGSLGKLIVRKLEKAGLTVVGCSRTGPNRVDVRDPKQVRRFVTGLLKKQGRIDVLVNNAGHVQPLVSLERISDEELFKSFQTNTFGPLFMMRCVIPAMIKQNNGIIINIASKAAVYTTPLLGAYSASKAALVSLTQAGAKELRNTNVLFFAVCPAGMKTNLRAAVFGEADANRQQDPARVAKVVSDIITKQSVENMHLNQGACVVVRKNEITVIPLQDG
jgi:NAD(P)-dependent dehydrogenase (short-subunit alcohol dehydrogenase family)